MMHYPVSAYQQLFPPGQATSPEQAYRLEPAEDGDHYQPEPDFFEWWYFDVALGDGAYLVAVFHSSLYNAIDHRPTLDLRYYPAAGDPIVAIGRYDRATYRAETDRCWVKIGECLAMDAGNCYRLDLRQGRLAAELTFWPTLPGWKAGTGHLLADPTNSRHFDWIVPLPRARVEGTLSVDGRPQQVTGEGYHDHNWGNVYLPSAFRGWTWGRIMADDWTLIFGDVVSRGSPPAHVTPFLLAHGEQIVVTTDRISVTGKDPLREPQTGRELFGKLHLSSSAGPSVRLELETRRKVEALDFAAPHACLARYPLMRKMGEYAFYLGQNFPFTRNLASWVLGRGSYVRWVADYHLELPDQDVVQAGQGLYEVMFL